MNLLAKITKTQLLLLFMTGCFLITLFSLYKTANDTADGTDYTITVTRRETEKVTPEVPSAPALIDINTATSEQLQTLTGIGEVIAQRIIDYREEHGPFTSIDELLNVKGIGEITLSKFRNDVTVSPPDDNDETTATEEKPYEDTGR